MRVWRWVALLLIIFTLGCVEKECETAADCLSKDCQKADCANNKCSYSSVPDCCGNEICEVGETYPECAADCPNCDDKNECTVDDYDYHAQECTSEPVIPCCGNDICDKDAEDYSSCPVDCPNCDDKNDCTVDDYDYHEQECINTPILDVICCGNGACEIGETYESCTRDCPNCDDDNECTSDSYEYHEQKCIHEPVIPCCGNGICDEGVENHSSCPKDCPDCDDADRLTTDSFNYATQKCENPVTHYLFDDFENGTQNWNFYPDASAFSTIVEDGNTVLKGIGHNHAGLQRKVWDDYGLKFRFKRISGFIAVDFRFSPIEGEPNKYYIILQQNQQQISIEKGKKVVGHADFEYDDNWHTFEVRGFSNILNVYIDDELLIKYKDTEDPILSGRVTFEVHGGSEYLIDDVEVKIVSEGEVVYP